MTARFYDVGQALAALVELPDGRHVLIDAGDSPGRPECGDVCAAKSRHPLERLRADLRGAPIDMLWITHQHSDHIGGAPEVIGAFAVGVLVDNGRDASKGEVVRAHRAAEERRVPITVVDPEHAASPLAGSADVTITPIVPAAWPPSCVHDPNECSIALRIDYCRSSVLFTGDAAAEEARLDTRGEVTLLQVGHHGSSGSTHPRFLAQTRPTYAVISAGKPDEGTNESYCHPRSSTVEALTRAMGGPGEREVEAFDGTVRCARGEAAHWMRVRASDRLWVTARDGDVALVTSGDGGFSRVEE